MTFGNSTDLVPLLRPLGQNPRAHERKNVPQPTGRLIPSFVEEGYKFLEKKQKSYSEFHPQWELYVQYPLDRVRRRGRGRHKLKLLAHTIRRSHIFPPRGIIECFGL